MEETDPAIQVDVENYLAIGGSPFGNCAILGANGMLSSYLLNFISAVNASYGERSQIFGFARSSSSFTKRLETRSNIRILHLSELNSILELQDVHVVHAASPSSLSDLRENKHALIESNINLTNNIHSLLEKTGGRLTFFSSGEVYGQDARIPTNETDYSPFDHLSVEGYYAETKKFTEMLNQIWSDETNLPVSILRIFHTFGPGIRRSDNRIFSSAIFGLLDSNRITLNSNGLATRTFMYSADLASAISVTSKVAGFHVFNVGGDEEIKILDFARLVSDFGQNSEVVFSDLNSDQNLSNNKIKRGHADTLKLRTLGWKPNVKISEAIKSTIRSAKWREENSIH
jgi:nucleoside-diphosphate-sugar epimerase